MIQKKICLLGSFAVGKTSLAARFVDRPFSGRYLTTIGVRIDRKRLHLAGQDLNLLLWDMAGEDRFQRVEASYLRGSAGYLLVVDGTRRSTLDQALLLHERAHGLLGPIPFSLLLNKADLAQDWEISDGDLSPFEGQGCPIVRTSAKTGDNVDAALHALAQRLLSP
jgi:small GTP-binding protein